MAAFFKNKKYLVGILVLVLIISVALNLYDYFVTFPQMHATTNNMRTEALKAWLSKMSLIKNLLSRAKTNDDIRDCEDHASWAELFEDVSESGIDIFESGKELYKGVSKAAYYLQYSLHRIYVGNQTGYVFTRNLDQYELVIIGNLTKTIENLESATSLALDGVEPTQQLKDAGVLADVLEYLEQIFEFSDVVYEYYGSLF